MSDLVQSNRPDALGLKASSGWAWPSLLALGALGRMGAVLPVVAIIWWAIYQVWL